MSEILDKENEGNVVEALPEENEPGHFEKATGVFTEPNSIFSRMSKFKPRATDWLMPVLFLIVAAILTNVILMSRPNIRYQVKQEQEEKLAKMVEEGKVTQEMADMQMEQFDKMAGGGVFIVIQAVSTVFFVFISFFLVCAVYYLFVRFVLKEQQGGFTSVLSVNGLANYISVLQLIILLIVSLAADRLFKGTSVADFAGMDKLTIGGFLLSKVEPFTIWALAVVSTGLARMFHSPDTKKFYFTIFGIWVVWSLITFALAKSVPFLSFLAGA